MSRPYDRGRMNDTRLTIRTKWEYLDYLQDKAYELGMSRNAYMNLLFRQDMEKSKNSPKDVH